MKTRTFLVGGLLVGGGAVLSHWLGSRPETEAQGSPLPALRGAPNGYASAPLRLAAPPRRVRSLVRVSLDHGGLYPLYGTPESVTPTEHGFDVVVALGPFRDDLSLAILPDGAGSAVWARSASRVGRTDLGVNRLRTRRLLADIERRVASAS